MAEIKLTKSQQAVVQDRGGALLVSAAAGSGKTKVLVDRLMSRICDTEAPCGIEDFLVITYTSAAAAELRMKIAQAMSQRLAQEPGNRHLQRQMNRIYLAEISTVHAFCADLLRTHAHLLDIPADFRIAEETESEVLQNKVLDLLLEQGYTEGSADFRTMAETFGYGRDDRHLPEAVKMLHKAMRCRADMDGWLEQTSEVLEIGQYETIGQTPWGAYVLTEFHAFLRQQIARMQAAVEEMQHYPAIEKSYGAVFRENINQLQTLEDCEDWDTVCANLAGSFGKLSAVRKPEDPQVKERLAGIRKKCWTDLQKWQKMFYAPSDALLQDMAQVTPGLQALLRFAHLFDQTYAEEKRRRKLMDFSDLEHLAIRLLTDRYTGKPTKLAQEISRKYVEIMVDEYQDSNQVQETIFEAISREGRNRFMVGDVKQSIYRFRLADPSLFLQKYGEYPDSDAAQEGEPRRILLSENFRSRPEILCACNDVFRLVMRRQVGDLDYGDAEALKAGRAFAPVPQTPVELHCLTSSAAEQELDKRDLEAEYVARRIRRLLDDQTPVTDGEELRPVRPGDIVILMRAVSSNAQSYLDALSRHGIHAVCSRGGSLLDTTEVQILMSMLQVVDNPHQDVPLLAVLASPVFAYTPDQLAQPREHNRRDDFFDAMGPDPVFQPFLELLRQLREDAGWMTLHELIDSVLQRTQMLAVFASMPDGVQRERNLMAFRNFTVGFEASGRHTLPQLLWYLQDLQANGGQLPVPPMETGDAVTIMSVHKSKGLEFPVVFLCDLSRQFNMQDTRDAILVDDRLAVGCNRVDQQRFIRYPTLAKKSIEHKKKRETISEELRVLYVAMTRAKDMLIMTYYSRRLQKELESLNSQITMPLSDDLVASVSNPGKWILLAALCRTEAGALHQLAGGNEVSEVSDTPWKIEVHDLFAEEDAEELPQEELLPMEEVDQSALNLLRFSYGYESVSSFPAKLTATQLKGRTQDQEAAEGGAELERRAAYQFRRAALLQRNLTAAEKGTAIHLFMQFARYEACTTMEDLEGELHRLRMQEFLTPEQAEAVDLQKVLTFFRSRLGEWLLQQPNLQREFKFSILSDAGAYAPQAAGEQVMLQGVVDCFVLQQDGITILDFKTDRVGNQLAERAAYYRPQLDAYADALARIYDIPVKRRILYFFDAGQAISI